MPFRYNRLLAPTVTIERFKRKQLGLMRCFCVSGGVIEPLPHLAFLRRPRFQVIHARRLHEDQRRAEDDAAEDRAIAERQSSAIRTSECAPGKRCSQDGNYGTPFSSNVAQTTDMLTWRLLRPGDHNNCLIWCAANCILFCEKDFVLPVAHRADL